MAERSGMMARIFRKQATRVGYALFLRNLLPAYQALEHGLEQNRGCPGVCRFARPETYRSEALQADLHAMMGADWAKLELLASGQAYAAHVRMAADGDGSGLIGHAYTRTLGDLSGGQMMQGLLATSLDLDARALGLYRFAGIDDIASYKAAYHADLNRAGTEIADPDVAISAAVVAFRMNIEVSAAVAEMDAGAE